jgi:hypothetical protein
MLIDRFLGFYRTPTVVPFEIPASHLRQLVRTYVRHQSAEQHCESPDVSCAIQAIESIINTCGARSQHDNDNDNDNTNDNTNDNDIVAGVLVGWLNFPVRYLQHRVGRRDPHYPARLGRSLSSDVRHAEQALPNLSVSSNASHIHWALETVAINLFGAMTNYMNRFMHNVFTLRDRTDSIDGPFAYLDNDRASWHEPSFDASKSNADQHELAHANNRMLQYCRFPASIAERILLLRPGPHHRASSTTPSSTVDTSNAFTLGRLILDTVRAAVPPLHWPNSVWNRQWFTAHNASVLDANVEHWAQAIELCLATKSRSTTDTHYEQVLVREPWLRAWEDAMIKLLDSQQHAPNASHATPLLYRKPTPEQIQVHNDYLPLADGVSDRNSAAELHRTVEFQIDLFAEQWIDRNAMATKWYEYLASVSHWSGVLFGDAVQHVRHEVRFNTRHCPVPDRTMRLRNYIDGPRAGASSLDWKEASYTGNFSSVLHHDMHVARNQIDTAFHKLEQGMLIAIVVVMVVVMVVVARLWLLVQSTLPFHY